MDDTLKALVAKVWKNADLELEPGTHFVDETFLVHINGTVVKQNDAMVAPTTSLPLITILALFCEKSGICRDHALRMLKEAIIEAMESGTTTKNAQIKTRMNDVESAVKAIKTDLIAKLPKQRRSGRVITKDLQIEVVTDDALAPAAA